MYAIIEDSGTQIKVSQGDVIEIELCRFPFSTSILGRLPVDSKEARRS